MPSDRLIEDVSTEDTLATGIPFIGDLTTKDAISAFALPVFILFFGQAVVPKSHQTYVVIAMAATGIIGILALIATPDHTPLGTFMTNFWHHKRRPKHVRYRRTDETEDVLDRSLLEYDERAQDLTDVEKIYPQYDAIELDDGTVVGAVRVTAANLDTADPERKNQAVESVKNFFENVLDFDIQIYVTTHGFDAQTMMEPYHDRLGDDALKQNPILQYHCRQHVRWVLQKMNGRPIREFYIVVPVEPDEVHEAQSSDETVSSSLEVLPVIGKAFGHAGDQDEYKLTKNELRLQQLSFLDERTEALQNQFASAISEQTSGKRVTAAKFAAMLREYWEGELVKESDMEELTSVLPVKVGENDPIETSNEVN